MRYLKVINTPLKILQQSKYFSYDGKIAWEPCGFNPIIVSSKAIQYVDVDENFMQYIPISDDAKFDAIWADLNQENVILGDGFNMEVLDDVDGTLYTQWKLDAAGGS
jgi:hypothetical protein